MTSFEMGSRGLGARLSWESAFPVSRGPGFLSPELIESKPGVALKISVTGEAEKKGPQGELCG